MKKLLVLTMVCTMLLGSMAAYGTDAITVYDATDNVIENEFGDAEQIKAKVNFTAEETAADARLVAARYDENGTLLTATSEDVEVVAGGTVDFTSELVTIDGADTVKFLLWSGFDSIIPLTTAETVVYSVEPGEKFYAVITEGTMEDNNVTIKAFAEEFGDEGWAMLTVSNSVTLNGISAAGVDVYNALNRDGVDGYRAAEGEIYPQPVKIIVNGNNEITYMAQASVAEYYSAVDKWTSSWYGSSSGYTLPEITEESSFPDYEPEFQLYMGDPLWSGQFTYGINILIQGTLPVAKANEQTHPYRRFEVNNPYFRYRALKPTTDTTVYTVPMYMDKSDTETIGKIAAQSTDLFAVSDIPRASFKMMAYKEGEESKICSFCMMLSDADNANSAICIDFDVRLVMEITTENINGNTVTAVNTNEGKFYIKQDTLDLNALSLYDYNGQQMSNPVTGEATYKVVPGDLINVKLNHRSYALAIEPVFDSTNGYFLADGGSNHKYRWIRRGTPDYRLDWLTPEYVDRVNDLIEGVSYDDGGFTEIKNITSMPEEYINTYEGVTIDCLVVDRDENGAITTRKATIDDVATADDPNGASVLILSHRYVALDGTSFIYPAEINKNWFK